MSHRGTLPVAALGAMEGAAARVGRLHVVPVPPEPRRACCVWCLWEASAAGRDAEMRLRVMLRAHRDVWHPDRLLS